MEAMRRTLAEEFKDPDARRDYAEEFLNSYIALQIKTLRQQRHWSQKDLAERAGMKQSRISAMEQADYSSWSVQTLRRLAAAFDLALTVRFDSFGTFLLDMTSIGRRALERPSFTDDTAFQQKRLGEPAVSDALAPVITFPGTPINRTALRIAI